jgi:hypothetical protein
MEFEMSKNYNMRLANDLIFSLEKINFPVKSIEDVVIGVGGDYRKTTIEDVVIGVGGDYRKTSGDNLGFAVKARILKDSGKIVVVPDRFATKPNKYGFDKLAVGKHVVITPNEMPLSGITAVRGAVASYRKRNNSNKRFSVTFRRMPDGPMDGTVIITRLM